MLLSNFSAGLRRARRALLYTLGQATFWSVASFSRKGWLGSVFRAGTPGPFMAPEGPAIHPRRAVRVRPGYGTTPRVA
jgi:hypothetical protein